MLKRLLAVFLVFSMVIGFGVTIHPQVVQAAVTLSVDRKSTRLNSSH